MPSTLLPLRQVRAVCAVAQAGSFTEGAKRLGLTQPAVSRAVAQVEQVLDVALFDRLGRGCTPTRAGAIIVHRAVRALASIETVAAGLSRSVSSSELSAAIWVAKAGSLAAAARHSGISQPALSQSLASLEGRIGKRLFARKSHAAAPASGTMGHIAAMELAFFEIEQGYEEIRFIKGATDGKLRIGALPIARRFLVPRAIEGVLATYGDTRISVIEGAFDSLESDLLSGRVDAIVGSLRTGTDPSEGLVAQKPFSDSLAIVCSFEHQLARVASIKLSRLFKPEQGWVLPFAGVPLREEFSRHLAAAGLPFPLRVIETDSITIVRALLTGGDRLAVVSAHQVEEELAGGQLVRLDLDTEADERPVGITFRADTRHKPVLARLIGTLEEISSQLKSNA